LQVRLEQINRSAASTRVVVSGALIVYWDELEIAGEALVSKLDRKRVVGIGCSQVTPNECIKLRGASCLLRGHVFTVSSYIS
jgi:hypothetical protein